MTLMAPGAPQCCSVAAQASFAPAAGTAVPSRTRRRGRRQKTKLTGAQRKRRRAAELSAVDATIEPQIQLAMPSAAYGEAPTRAIPGGVRGTGPDGSAAVPDGTACHVRLALAAAPGAALS